MNDLVVCPHPLSLEGRVIARGAELRPGDTLRTFVERAGVDLVEGGWALSIGGAQVPELMWGRTRPAHGQLIECRRVPGKNAIRSASQILVAVATIWVSINYGPWWAFAFNVGANALVNKLLPPPQLKLNSYNQATGSTYDINGGRNRARPFEPLGLVFGVVKVVPDYATQPYQWFEGDDQLQYVRLHAGINCGSVATIKIGDTDIGSYSDVSVTMAGFPGMSTSLEDWSSVDTIAGGTLTSGGGYVSRTSSAASVRLAVDLVAQLYDMADDGSMNLASVEFTAEYRLHPAGPWQPFDGTSISTTMTSRSTQPARLTLVSPLLTSGQFDVRLSKTTADVSTARSSNALQWVSLKSYQVDSNDYTSYPQVGIRIKASGQLNGALDQVNWIATSQPTPVWDGSAWSTVSTRNPGAHFLQVARGIYDSTGKLMAGMGLPDAQIDVAGLQDFMVQCTAKGYVFDHWFDSMVSCGEMLEAIASTGLATVSYHTGKLGVIWLDSGQPVEAVVNMATIKRATFRVDYSVRDTSDEIETSWFDRDDGWLSRSLRVKAPGVTMPRDTARQAPVGITTQAGALLAARVSMAQNVYQRKAISWESDLEYLTFRRYSIIALSHDMTQWGYGGRLHAAVAPGGVVSITLDAEVPWNSGASARKVGIRVPGETGYRIFGVAAFSGTAHQLTLTEAWPSGVPFPGDSAGNPAHDYVWIYDFKASPGRRLRVTSIEPSANLGGAKVTAVPEDDEFWSFVTSGTYVAGPSPAAVQALQLSNPVITQRRLGLSTVAGVGLSVAFNVVGPYDHAQVWGAAQGSALHYLGQTRTASFSEWTVTEGDVVVLELRGFDSLGRPAPVVHVEYTVTVDDPVADVVTGLRVHRVFAGGLELRWDVSSRSDLRTELRLNGSDWESGAALFSGNGNAYPWAWPADGHYVIRARRSNAWGRYGAAEVQIEFDVAGYKLLNCPAAWATIDEQTAQWQASVEDPESGEVIGYTPAVWLCGPIDTRVSTPEIADYAVTDGLSLVSSLAYPLTYLYRPHLVDPINLTPLVDLFVDLTVVADLSISFDGYDWGTPYIRTAAAEAAYTVEADFTGYPSGPPLETAGTGNYWQTAGATGWVFGPEQSATRVRATYTLRSSFALSAGVSYRVGLVADGDPSEFGAGSTVYALSTSITLRKK